jgi:hypothetical protein
MRWEEHCFLTSWQEPHDLRNLWGKKGLHIDANVSYIADGFSSMRWVLSRTPVGSVDSKKGQSFSKLAPDSRKRQTVV